MDAHHIMIMKDIELEKATVTRLVQAYIDRGELRMFFNSTANGDEAAEQMLCVRVSDMLGKMDEYVKEQVLMSLVERVRDEEERRELFERTIDKIFKYAFQEGTITAMQALHNLLMTCDFSLRSNLNTEKLTFIKDRLHLVDYKGVRTIFKTLTETQMLLLPVNLSEKHRKMLAPAEELLLYIMERETNALPALFAAAELNTLASKRSLSMCIFPLVVAKAVEMENSFRPLAELAYVTGRSFLFPIPSHPAFITTAQLWKIDATTVVTTHRLHLPYKTDLYQPQNYMLYMMLKQPRGKDNLMAVMRPGTTIGTKAHLDNILIVLAMEAMHQMEKSDQVTQSRYVWDNVFHSLYSTISAGWCSLNRFIPLVAASMDKMRYRKSRDELMWIILQLVSIFPVSPDALSRIGILYSKLYDDCESMVIASDCPTHMTRSLSAACLWKLLSADKIDNQGNTIKSEFDVEPPSHFLRSQIEMITGQAETADNDSMLAVIANAYAHNSTEHKRVCKLLFSRLNPSDASLHLMGRQTRSHYAPISDDILESLGVRTQQALLGFCLGEIKERKDNPDWLPSPGLVETVARILCMLEPEMGLKTLSSHFARHIGQIITAGNFDQKGLDYLFILIELISYRCTSLPFTQFRHNLSAAVLNQMNHGFVQSRIQLYTAVEQMCIRLWSWLPPADNIHLVPHCLGYNRSSQPPRENVFLNPNRQSNFVPEFTRSLFLPYLRSIKLVGQELNPDLAARMKSAYLWPDSQLATLAPSLLPTDPQMEDDDAKEFNELNKNIHSDYTQMCGLPENSWPDYFIHRLEYPTLFCSYFKYLVYKKMTVENNNVVLQIVDRMTGKQVVAASNALVDELVKNAMEEKDMDEFFLRTSDVLKMMVMDTQMVTMDRIFFACAFKPRSDIGTAASLSLVRAIARLPSFRDQINAFYQLPRVHAPDYIKKLIEFNHKFPERIPMQNGPPLPVYYSNPLLRLLPSIDILLERALQIKLPDAQLKEFLDTFAPLYKYHPYPLTTCFSMLSSLYEVIGHTPRARQLVISMVKTEPCPLTHEFQVYNHHRDEKTKVAAELVRNLIAAIDINGSPPPWVAPDWRGTELPPAGQTLYAIGCELLASPYRPKEMGDAFISFLVTANMKQPMLCLNAVALILTALPVSYSSFLFDEILMAYESEALEELSLEEAIFESYEQLCRGRIASRLAVVLALSQACWHHASAPTLIEFVERFEKSLRNEQVVLVKTEKDFFFTLHILIPLLQRTADMKEKKHIDTCFRMVVLIYKILHGVCEKGPLQKEDTICDLLYHFKYLFVGDHVREEIDDLIARMPQSLKTKLKFIAATTGEKAKNEGGEIHEELDRKVSM